MMNYILIEIRKFFKNNLMKIILGTLFFGLLFTGIEYIINQRDKSMVDNFEIETNGAKVEVDAAPGIFQFYIEDSDGDVFINNALIEEIITLPEALHEASIQTRTNLEEFIEYTGNKSITTASGTTDKQDADKVIGVSRDVDSQVMTFYVNIGSEADNIKIAEYYYDFIVAEQTTILSDKIVYTLLEPELVENDSEEIAIDKEKTKVINLKRIFFVVISSSILGLFLTIGLLILLSFFSKKLHYFFTYTIKNQDLFLLVDEKTLLKDELTALFNSDLMNHNRFIEETGQALNGRSYNGLFEEVLGNTTVDTHSNVFEIEDTTEVERIVYIVNEGETSREWYNRQRKAELLYHFKPIVIQVNKRQ